METEKMETGKMCQVCKDRVDLKDEYGRYNRIIIDQQNKVFDCEVCLFDYHKKSYKRYVNRTDKLDNYIDLGLIDVKYDGSYYEGVIEEVTEEQRKSAHC